MVKVVVRFLDEILSAESSAAIQAKTKLAKEEYPEYFPVLSLVSVHARRIRQLCRLEKEQR